MPVCRIGLVGGGGISRAHLAAASASEGRVRIVAAADSSETARRGLADAIGANVFSSIDELLEKRRSLNIDALLACTPPSVRLEIVNKSLASGVPILVEKPLAHTLTDAKQLAGLAAANSTIPTAVAYCHRFTPAVVDMRRQLHAGALGEPVRFENTFAGPNPGLREKWMSDPTISGGGSFIDTGCHSLDLYRHLLGDAEVSGAVFANHWPGRGESHTTVLIKGSHGCAGIISSGWVEPGRFVLTLVGTEGLLTYDYEKPTELIHYPCKGELRRLPVESHEARFSRQLVEFARYVETGERGAQLASFEDGLAVSQLVDDARKLAMNG